MMVIAFSNERSVYPWGCRAGSFFNRLNGFILTITGEFFSINSYENGNKFRKGTDG
jgi:hypothetical protein